MEGQWRLPIVPLSCSGFAWEIAKQCNDEAVLINVETGLCFLVFISIVNKLSFPRGITIVQNIG